MRQSVLQREAKAPGMLRQWAALAAAVLLLAIATAQDPQPPLTMQVRSCNALRRRLRLPFAAWQLRKTALLNSA